MNGIIGYTTTSRKVMFNGREITETDSYPIFINEEERQRVKQNIEHNLYKIFSKHREKSA